MGEQSTPLLTSIDMLKVLLTPLCSHIINCNLYRHHLGGSLHLHNLPISSCSKQWEYQVQCLKILKKAKIVGMTTTGAAIHQQLLNKLEAPVVLVEEAAEVLESNLLAALTPHVKHLVLFGDHKQLRPRVYTLLIIIPACTMSILHFLHRLLVIGWGNITNSIHRCLRGWLRTTFRTQF